MALRTVVPFLSLLTGAILAAGSVYGCSSENAAAVADAGSEGDGGGNGDAGEQDSGGDAGSDAVTCPAAIAPGLNSLSIGSVERKFYIDLPTDTSQPMALIFSWHGFGDTAENFRKAVHLDPNQDSTVPAIIVTPDDSGIQPPKGLDWDIAKGTTADANVDIAFFDAMLGCLKGAQKIDETRIYSIGFSAGAVMTNLLHSRHPKLFAAIVTESGAWMNDKAETDLVNLIKVEWNWPALDPADSGNVLLTHGGAEDVTAFNVLDLEKSAQAAIPFLKEAKRVVVDCAHTKGHTLHPEVTQPIIAKYLFAHRAGQPSPFQGGPDGGSFDGFPASCTLRLP